MPGSFLGTIPRGETLKLANGGDEKGPAILPDLTSLSNFSLTISGKFKTETRLA